MSELDREFIRRLAGWETNGAPVSTLYLDVNGRRYPRRQDYERRAGELIDRVREQASGLDRSEQLSVGRDADRMSEFIRGLDRGATRGIVLFSCTGAGRWEEVLLPRPVPDQAVVATQPFVLPLEGIVEMFESFCTALVDREKARLFLARIGRIQEETDVADDVPGQHDQGGWSQARYERHIEDHVGRHFKHVEGLLLRLLKRKAFDHLILSGPEEVVAGFERGLHDYLGRRVVARLTLPVTASADEVLRRSLAVEEEIEAEREAKLLERLAAEAGSGRHGVTGLRGVVEALNDGRVDTLVVPAGVSGHGLRCEACGALALDGSSCRMCGGPLKPLPDLVEGAVEAALRQGSRVEMLTFAGRNGEVDELGALLRF
jgi:peptide chain release factor subunit 1